MPKNGCHVLAKLLQRPHGKDTKIRRRQPHFDVPRGTARRRDAFGVGIVHRHTVELLSALSSEKAEGSSIQKVQSNNNSLIILCVQNYSRDLVTP